MKKLLVGLLITWVSTFGQIQRSHEEETIVRTAYAKLSYADEVRIILDALQNTGREKLWTSSANLVDSALNSRLKFELSNFRFGQLSAIANRKISEFDGTPTQIGGAIWMSRQASTTTPLTNRQPSMLPM
jgi:hypothetical protein